MASQGNYGFRELLLHPELRPASATLSLSALQADNITVWADPLWWVWRQRLQGADDPSTADGARHLQRVRSRLSADDDSRLYDVIGIVERWADTCRLLDAMLPWPASVWNADNRSSSCAYESHEHREAHGSSRWASAERTARAAAEHDPAVRRLLAADLAIYESMALPAFERQLRRLG